MAPSLKGKRKKKSVPMAESESQEIPVLCPEEEHQDNLEKLEEAVSPSDKQDATSEAEQKPPEDDSGDEEMLSGEKEEEQTFLVNLYKFMKERHTPIERVPHLGFKQINLFKIYKAVEKLGAYELVTGRRLWKNVYDMLGGSPGSTSAATCTRRHYERLVLPYVRHLKGEDDKPLPPVKPRKQYKISKEPKGDRVAEKKRTKKEKMRDPSLPEKARPDVALVSKPPNVTEPIQPREQTEGRLSLPNSREMAETLPAASCLGNCQSHGCSEAYTRLFSSFYFKGNNGIMSPLAKKKLLAQVSQDECLYAHEKKHLSHCPEYKKIRIREIPGLDSEVGRLQKEAPKTGAEMNGSSSSPGPSQVGKTNEGLMKVPPGFKEGPGSMKAEEESSGAHLSTGPPVFRGYFHTSSSSTILKPVSGLRGPVEYYSSLKDLSVTSSAYSKPGKDALVVAGSQKKQESLEDQPEDLRRKSSQPWKADHQRSSAFQASTLSTKAGSPPFQPVKASWVPPVVNLAKVSPQVSKNGGPSVSPGQASIPVQKKRASEEDYFLHGKKLKAVSPFVKEVDSNSSLDQGTSPGGQPGIAKPKATVAGSRFPVAHMPQIQDMYKGTMLRLPVNFSSPGEHLKEQAPSLIQSLSINPFIIPAFPTPLLTASIQPSDLGQSLGASLVHYPTSYDSALRHRLYPVSTWHSQPTYASAHVPSYHRNTKL